MRTRTIASLTAALLTTWTTGDAAAQGEWSQFRGPGGRGVATGDATLPVEFGPSENLIWKRDVDEGHSSPCVWGDRIFLTAHDEQELATVCIDRTAGSVLWRKSVKAPALERLHRINGPASSTPTADGERVYAYFGSFGLICYDFEGEEVWRREMPTAENSFGTAASPIVVGERLILNRDTNKGSFLEAIDGETGDTVWKKDRSGFKSGWSTPTLWKRGGTDEILVYGAWWITAYALEDGEERWSVPGLTDEPCITPVTGEGMVFVSSYNMKTNTEVIGLPEFEKLVRDYDADADGRLNFEEIESNESILSRADADGEGDHPMRIFFRFLDEDRSGDITEEEWKKIIAWVDGFAHANALMAIRPGAEGEGAEIVWQYPHGVPECPSPLYYDGRVYVVKNGGMATCLDAETGEVEFQGRLDSRGPCYASPVVGDGKIYSASARGVVTVFAATDELEVLARNDLEERIMATPALVDGRIYVRTDKTLYAFGLSD